MIRRSITVGIITAHRYGRLRIAQVMCAYSAVIQVLIEVIVGIIALLMYPAAFGLFIESPRLVKRYKRKPRRSGSDIAKTAVMLLCLVHCICLITKNYIASRIFSTYVQLIFGNIMSSILIPRTYRKIEIVI